MTEDAPQSRQGACRCVGVGLVPLGTVADYAALHGLLRARHAALGISYETLNTISGLGYCEKLLAPMSYWQDKAKNGKRTSRGIGPVSFGPLLQALGLVLIVAEDPAATERLKRRQLWARRNETYVSAASSSIDEIVQRRQRLEANLRCAGARAAYVAQVPPERRQKIARNAARARWAHKRKLAARARWAGAARDA